MSKNKPGWVELACACKSKQEEMTVHVLLALQFTCRTAIVVTFSCVVIRLRYTLCQIITE